MTTLCDRLTLGKRGHLTANPHNCPRTWRVHADSRTCLVQRFSLPHSVIVLNPLQRPSPRLTASAAASGAVGVLELPTGDPREVVDLLDRTCRWSAVPFAVRIPEGCSATARELPELVDTVLLADPARPPADFAGRRVLAEVTSLAEALTAAEAGATGLIVRGSESGGRAGELSTFVLLQQVLGEPALDLPTWACGGIGPHTAAATVAGGAAGVVLDSQLALFDEAGLPTELTGVLAGLDGSETVLHHGVRVLRRRGPGALNSLLIKPSSSPGSARTISVPSSSRSARTPSSRRRSPSAGARSPRPCAASVPPWPPRSRMTRPPPRWSPGRPVPVRSAPGCPSPRGR